MSMKIKLLRFLPASLILIVLVVASFQTPTVLAEEPMRSANRAPNVAELFSPVTTGLSNATSDPCSVANAANIDARLRGLCESTGMLPGQVGVLQDIVAAEGETVGVDALLGSIGEGEGKAAAPATPASMADKTKTNNL